MVINHSNQNYNNTPLLFISSNSNIGINKSNPNSSYKLDINRYINTNDVYLNNLNFSNIFITSNVLSNTFTNYNKPSIYTSDETSNIFVNSNVLSNISNILANYNNIYNRPNIFNKDETSNIFVNSNVLSNTSNTLANYNNLYNKPDIYTKTETSNIFCKFLFRFWNQWYFN